MQKNIFLVVILALILTGCAQAGSDVAFMDASNEGFTTDTILVQASAEESSYEESETLLEAEKEEDAAGIFVYVCGAVNLPGVYELPEGSRIIDAVEASGGFNEEADDTYVNLAAVISDGMKLQIPTREQTAGAGSGIAPIENFDGAGGRADLSGSEKESSLVNINTASREELTSIPGIGSVTAQKIVSFREENGSFKSIEDVMNVSGIKDKLFSKIKDYITV